MRGYGSFLYDLTGSYVLSFAVFAAAFAAGGLVALAARPPASRRVHARA